MLWCWGMTSTKWRQNTIIFSLCSVNGNNNSEKLNYSDGRNNITWIMSQSTSIMIQYRITNAPETRHNSSGNLFSCIPIILSQSYLSMCTSTPNLHEQLKSTNKSIQLQSSSSILFLKNTNWSITCPTNYNYKVKIAIQ